MPRPTGSRPAPSAPSTSSFRSSRVTPSPSTANSNRARPAPSSSRSKGRLAVNTNASSYTTFDDTMDAGVESEEKGERHQFGSKAQRFFEQAYRLYTRALQLARPGSNHGGDALYNAARVQYLLATQFYLPPQSLGTLTDSVVLFKMALNVAPLPSDEAQASGTLPSLFSLDVVSNLATSLQTLAELVEEVGWLNQVESVERLAGLTDYGTFEGASNDHCDPRVPTPSKMLQEAISYFRLASLGQQQVLIDQAKETAEEGRDDGAADVEETASTNQAQDQVDPSSETEMDDNDPAPTAPTLDAVGYTSSLVTVDTYIDTLISLHSCLVTLLASCDTVAQAHLCTASALEALDRASAALDPSTSSLPALEESEKAAKALELQRARLSLRVAHVTRLADVVQPFPSNVEEASEVEQLEQTAMEWCKALLSPGSSADTATLCELGDATLSLCRLRLRSLRLDASNTASISLAWTLGTLTSKIFNSALSTLSTSSASVILGAHNTSTPTSRTRASILTALAATSIVRSCPIFESSNLPNAVGMRGKLLDNARIYGRKACTEVGMGWILSSPSSRSSFSSIIAEGASHQATFHTHAHGGFETLSCESESLFTLLRALYLRSTLPSTNAITAIKEEIETISWHVSTLGRKDEAFEMVLLRSDSGEMELDARKRVTGVQRFLQGLVDEEGQKCLDDAEIEFWKDWQHRVQGGAE